MSTDFALDDDPLGSLMLSPDSALDDDDNGLAAPDWSQFTNILGMDDTPTDSASATNGTPSAKFASPSAFLDMSSHHHLHQQGLNDDFLTMDFNPTMVIEPDGYNHLGLGLPGDVSMFSTDDFNEALSAAAAAQFQQSQTFPFTFQQNDFVMPRRLSVTSSSSSSGGSSSLSPVMQSMAASPADSSSASSYTMDPADELAQRVRQAAGVMLAVPQQQHQQHQEQQMQQQYSNDISSQIKLPIPRLHQSSSVPPAPKQSKQRLSPPTASPPSTIKSSPSPTPPPPEPVQTTSTSTRPRTSHTTIERRYRTNLNTRIQSLRNVVPALRVLDKKTPHPADIVDERGFVDGVKVARKCSKANVLGKAEEYIRVLKRREMRLLGEQNGLKALISGLVGGPALLREWEKEWRIKFGGEEKDEIELGEGGGGGGDDSDDEDGEEDEDDSADGGRKRKKAKVMPVKKEPSVKADSAMMGVSADGQQPVVPEKRKRGRPRKVVPPPPVVVEPIAAPVAAAPRQPQQYLLAVFALFSFFNSSPSTIFTSKGAGEHSHTGVVLTASHPGAQVHTQTLWGTTLQSFHLLVSILVFLSIVVPWIIPSWLSLSLKKPKSTSSENNNRSILRKILSPLTPSSSSSSSSPNSPTPVTPRRQQFSRDHRTALASALAPARRGSPDEVAELRNAVGAASVWSWVFFSLFGGGNAVARDKESSFEIRGLEQRVWVRLGEIVALSPNTSTMLTRIQTYWSMSKLIPQFGASVSDMLTLALVLHPLAPKRAKAVWERARYKARVGSGVRACERMVVEELGVEEAVRVLSQRNMESKDDSSNRNGKDMPITVLAEILVRERMERDARRVFVRTVLGSAGDADENSTTKIKKGAVAVGTSEAAKSLGGRIADMGDLLERLDCDCDASTTVGELVDLQGAAESWLSSRVATGGGGGVQGGNRDANVEALLTALVLYKQVFPSSSNYSTVTDTPSIVLEDRKMQLMLRTALGEEVFECSSVSGDGGEDGDGLLEDARDRVVDMLVECERRGRC